MHTLPRTVHQMAPQLNNRYIFLTLVTTFCNPCNSLCTYSCIILQIIITQSISSSVIIFKSFWRGQINTHPFVTKFSLVEVWRGQINTHPFVTKFSLVEVDK